MRTSRLTPLALAAALALPIAACSPAADEGDSDDAIGESVDGVAEGDALSGEEIEEAVPGVTDAAPEGATGNTADLGDPSNVEYTEEGEY